jgi:hypothetical protein
MYNGKVISGKCSYEWENISLMNKLCFWKQYETEICIFGEVNINKLHTHGKKRKEN